MTSVWILIALWVGTMAGFLLFALMAMARESERDDSRMLAQPMRKPAHSRAL